VKGDFGDVAVLEKIFQTHRIDAVLHLAGETIVEFSIKDPGRYFRRNVTAGIALLETMLKCGVKRIVFSSSAAVYGEPASIPIRENDAALPVNAYGESKLMFERILQWFGKAYGLKHISLRYFNAAGASARYGEDHNPETHLIPNVLKVALAQAGAVKIFGTDYTTKDGTCVRDYIHVLDIAAAHILALEKIDRVSSSAYNMGNGSGFSVMEVVEVARKITGLDIPITSAPRRTGDPAVLVAGAEKIAEELGWKPEFPHLEQIVESAWQWHRKYPLGYAGKQAA
jgi:UDP-glucose 4-epimerase